MGVGRYLEHEKALRDVQKFLYSGKAEMSLAISLTDVVLLAEAALRHRKVVRASLQKVKAGREAG